MYFIFLLIIINSECTWNIFSTTKAKEFILSNHKARKWNRLNLLTQHDFHQVRHILETSKPRGVDLKNILDDKYSNERITTKKRFGLLPTQQPAHVLWFHNAVISPLGNLSPRETLPDPGNMIPGLFSLDTVQDCVLLYVDYCINWGII